MRTANLKSWIRWALVVFLAVGGMRVAAQVDCLGVDGGPALPGTPCDDGQPFTNAGTWNSACQCIGFCSFWDMGWGYPGDVCDDYDPLTIQPAYIGADCICHSYCSIGLSPLSPCDDGDSLTIDDMVDRWGCSCYGWSDSIVGRVFLDVDLNGVFGGADLPIQNRLVQAGFGPTYTNSDASGMFYFRATPAYYQLTAAAGEFDTLATPVEVLDLSGPGITSGGHELAMNATASQGDLAVYLTRRVPRPGFYNKVTVICRNEGTQIMQGSMSLTFDPLQVFSNSAPAAVPVGGTATWTLPEMQLGETFVANVWMYTPPSVALGTVVQYVAQVQPTPPDAVPTNDVKVLDVTVSGSFDPNDIQVTPALLTADDVAAATPVTYTIRFQNTGTFLAENVRVTDLLPVQLRPYSFDFIASSHPCHAQLTNGLLEFRFDNIMLPDSTSDEPNSHGWVMFQMKPQNFLLPGAQVGNSASIYFDFNDPIYTNSAVFEVEDLSTTVHEAAPDKLKLWPNPATDLLNLSMDRPSRTSSVTIIDMNGRIVRSLSNVAVQDNTLTIPVADLADGLYTLRIGDGLKARNQRFVKSH